jgi:L-alanine-DL-glutamate epimerase-like enolase superfamily enzyme
MKIERVEAKILMDPGFDPAATSSAQDDILVFIYTDDGHVGIGETDLNPVIAKACLDAYSSHTMARGLTELLIGSDPFDVEGIWERLYVGSAMNGRRGAVVNTIGAIDIALHDLRGKLLGKPCHELLGEPREAAIQPYASLQPDAETFDEYVDAITGWAVSAVHAGFPAVKLEITPAGPYAHHGMQAPFERMVEPIAATRRAVGPGTAILVDVQYAFPDADTCLRAIESWQEFDVGFLEAPLPSDDHAGYARLAAEQGIPIAAGEWLATRYEFIELFDMSQVAIGQPDVARVGGLTEAVRVCDLAAARGIRIVPHAWKTGISVAAAAHLAKVTPHCAYIEYLPPDLCSSRLRRDLVRTGPSLRDGEIVLPDAPGLGVELDGDAVDEFEQYAKKMLGS